ncbi:WD40-repeat-containing domain protein [Gautieria morchelliformis]|nr:WD40-repeat-containing domain protein [Gautieria morchelliformis]
MAHSDSEDAEGFGNDKDEDLDNENDAEAEESDADGDLDAEGEVDSDGDEESVSESEEESEEGEDDNDEEHSPEVAEDAENEEEEEEEEEESPSEAPASQNKQKSTCCISPHPDLHSPSPQSRRSLSPAFLRPQVKSYTIETICALPHPVATHSLASSLCMTHLLTGSDDGNIRDYDVFTAGNGKNFLSQPQRQHCGIQEGAIKAPVARMWWENPLQPPGQPDDNPVGQTLSPVYSLLVHSDALWGLSEQSGSVNLFTIRHDPGHVVHSLSGHLGPVSALAMLPGEKGFISAGWDGEALQWDLNTGQRVRNFSHGAQLTAVAMRPISGPLTPEPVDRVAITPGPVPNIATKTGTSDGGKQDVTGDVDNSVQVTQSKPEAEAKSEASYDPLFDDEPDGVQPKQDPNSAPAFPAPAKPNGVTPASHKLPSAQAGLVPPPKKPTIPLLDPVSYGEYSSDILLAASIDGQVVLWDRRTQTNRGVGRLEMSEKCPPWCLSACWSCDGSQIYAGRRNGTVDMWDTRILGKSSMGTPRLLKTLRNPPSSGAVSSVVAFPDGNHVVCASLDNIRLWNVADAPESDATRRTTPAFKIIAGHHGGIISQILVDIGARFMVSASGNRGWSGDSTRTVLVHDVKGAK